MNRPAGRLPATLLATLLAERRAIEVAIAGEQRFVAAEDAARYRDALGCAAADRPAPGVHRSGAAPARGARRPLRPDPRAVRRARARHSLRAVRSRGSPVPWPPSSSTAVSSVVSSAPTASAESGATSRSSASCVAARSPPCAGRSSRSSTATLAEFLPAWQGVGQHAARRRGARRDDRGACRRAARGVDAGGRRARRPRRRLPGVDARRAVHGGRRRVAGCRGHRLERRAGTPVLRRSDRPAGAELGARRSTRPGALHDTVRDLLAAGGASFWSQLRAGAIGPTDAELLAALWDLVWAGEVTNDSLAALRSMTTGKGGAARRPGGSAGRGARPRAAVAARPHRPGRRRRALEPRRPAARTAPNRHGVRPRHGDAARRAARRRHP